MSADFRASVTFEDEDAILSPDELRAMFMQRRYTPQDVEKLLISHAALVRKVKLMEDERAYLVVHRCRSCGQQVTWDQRTRLSYGWFHGNPGPECEYGQYLPDDGVEEIVVKER